MGGASRQWRYLAALSPGRYLAVIAGLALSGLGLWMVVAATIRPSLEGAVIVALEGFLFLALGVMLAVSALTVGRGERALHTPQD